MSCHVCAQPAFSILQLKAVKAKSTVTRNHCSSSRSKSRSRDSDKQVSSCLCTTDCLHSPCNQVHSYLDQKADLVVPRRSKAAPSLVAACSSPVMISATGALLVKRVWRVTTSSRASKIGLMSNAALISCTTYHSVSVCLRAKHGMCHRKSTLVILV